MNNLLSSLLAVPRTNVGGGFPKGYRVCSSLSRMKFSETNTDVRRRQPPFQNAPPTQHLSFGFTPTAARRSQSTSRIKTMEPHHRPDPFARRPNKKCDPYGQNGAPLSRDDAHRLLLTVEDEWYLEVEDAHEGSSLPVALIRTFRHATFLDAASFAHHMAAVAEMNDHFPRITIDRQLNGRAKEWTPTTTARCHTTVLQGLSHHDFFLASLIDVEAERTEVKRLVLEPER